MGHSEARQTAETLLEELRREVKLFSYDEIESINNILGNAISLGRQEVNKRLPLFTLPIEILHEILELVPDPCTRRWSSFRPFWHNTLLDSSMLIPVARTCHRLREVALAHPHLWTTFQICPETQSFVGQMSTWSECFPLNVAGSAISILEELPPNIRFESVYLNVIKEDDFDLLPTVIRRLSSPTLHSFSICCGMNWSSSNDERGLPILSEHAPNIREQTLDWVKAVPNKGFPCLTRLALVNYTSAYCTGLDPESSPLPRLVQFIGECPHLESVDLMGFDVWGGARKPSPIPLHHLKHVSFYNFTPGALRYFVALLQPQVEGSSIQILGCYHLDVSFTRRFLLLHDLEAPETETPSQICIGVHPAHFSDRVPWLELFFSITTVFPRATRRIAVWERDVGHGPMHNDSYRWPSDVLSQSPTSPLSLPVDELWLYGHSRPLVSQQHSPLCYGPHAPCVVVAVDRRLIRADWPTLGFLPSAQNFWRGPISITSLRLVHGFSEPDDSESPDMPLKSDPDPRLAVSQINLPLERVVQDLRSGQYDYLKHIVLQVMPGVHVDEKELAEVQQAAARFATFRFERIEEFPRMPGHSDPAPHERFPTVFW